MRTLFPSPSRSPRYHLTAIVSYWNREVVLHFSDPVFHGSDSRVLAELGNWRDAYVTVKLRHISLPWRNRHALLASRSYFIYDDFISLLFFCRLTSACVCVYVELFLPSIHSFIHIFSFFLLWKHQHYRSRADSFSLLLTLRPLLCDKTKTRNSDVEDSEAEILRKKKFHTLSFVELGPSLISMIFLCLAT